MVVIVEANDASPLGKETHCCITEVDLLPGKREGSTEARESHGPFNSGGMGELNKSLLLLRPVTAYLWCEASMSLALSSHSLNGYMCSSGDLVSKSSPAANEAVPCFLGDC